MLCGDPALPRQQGSLLGRTDEIQGNAKHLFGAGLIAGVAGGRSLLTANRLGDATRIFCLDLLP